VDFGRKWHKKEPDVMTFSVEHKTKSSFPPADWEDALKIQLTGVYIENQCCGAETSCFGSRSGSGSRSDSRFGSRSGLRKFQLWLQLNFVTTCYHSFHSKK
jgi:hypothetical protein